ncbi:hypothetical protein SAMN05216214_111138 [Atopomonas hussainii]|uniref:Uncharacterized protein n=1 Tax=Atopomonas hussainii TaxID=1429083 RepID=A0A1H7PV98_9GAMM|nr:hypothetical protein [Atopomonas hussainii]SEL38997.1 hypothetical protein SAMN05216214_111138 [Atopomonas hussainii]
MAEHDFRYALLNPQHTLTECRALSPGRYQVTGIGGAIHSGDTLIVTLKGSRDLPLRLCVEKVRHMIRPAGQWLAVASGPVFNELAIHQWQVQCEQCGNREELEFATDAKADKASLPKAANARLLELGWQAEPQHLCPRCLKEHT